MSVYYTKLKGIIALVRVQNFFLTIVSVFIGASVAGGVLTHLDKVIYAAFSAGLILAGGNMLNDYYDIQTDAVNKPHRPIPAGIISKKTALYLSGIFSVSGFLLCFFINENALLIAMTALFLLFQYNRVYKKKMLVGNIIVSLLAGLVFIYGGAAAGNMTAALIPAVFAFLFHFGREIIKDAEDIEGDEASGMTTFAVRYGVKKSIYLSAGIFFILAIFMFYPYVFLAYSIYYLIVVITGVEAVIFYTFSLLFKEQNKTILAKAGIILKTGMFIGLLALLLK